MTRRSVSTALMFGAPVVAIIAAFIIGMVEVNRGVPTGCVGDCAQQLAAEASHRHVLVLACLGLAAACAVAGYLIRPRA